MKDKPENQPAFPTLHNNDHAGQIIASNGMTLRDYFAAKAMQAMLSSNAWCSLIAKKSNGDNKKGDEYLATQCYEAADAMLAERSKGDE